MELKCTQRVNQMESTLKYFLLINCITHHFQNEQLGEASFRNVSKEFQKFKMSKVILSFDASLESAS